MAGTGSGTGEGATDNSAPGPASGPERNPLNVVVVLLGGVRADHVSGFGYGIETMPYLDRLARDAVRFPLTISAAPSTVPSIAALFTGKHSAANGVTDERPVLESGHATLAECLRGAGYRTAAFSASPWLDAHNGLGRGFDVLLPRRPRTGLGARVSEFVRDRVDRLLRRDDAGGRRTARAFRRWLASAPRPFYAFVEFAEARFPPAPPPGAARVFLPRGVAPKRARDLRRGIGAEGASTPTAAEAAILKASYDAALRHVDACVRVLAEALQARREWDRTLFVVTADHGECLGERGAFGHAAGVSEALLHVPLVLFCPARLPRGFVVDELAQTTDVAPTVLAVAGLEDAADGMGGRALLAGGAVVPGPGYAVAERYRGGAAPGAGVRRKAIRTRREKFVWSSDEDNEFYDLARDPEERENRIESEAARADALRRRLFDWLATTGRGSFSAPAAGGAEAVSTEADSMRRMGTR